MFIKDWQQVHSLQYQVLSLEQTMQSRPVQNFPNSNNSAPSDAFINKINSSVVDKYAMAISEVRGTEIIFKSAEQIQMEWRDNHSESSEAKKGRGGNNVAENLKKSLLSCIRRVLSPELYKEYENMYITKYGLKSQKENFVLFFMFLHLMVRQRKISLSVVELIAEQMKRKINRYIDNSRNRMEKEAERVEFHSKNIQEFSKYLDIDVDFSQQRQFDQVCEQIRPFFLRKQASFEVAKSKIRSVLSGEPELQIMVKMEQSVKMEE